jgi:Methyltransferase domain
MDDRAEHWDSTYADRGTTGVSWFQAVPTPSLHMIDVLGIVPSAKVIDVGGGAASLVDHLIARGFEDLTVLDIAEVALTTARARVGDQAPVSWVREDVLTWRPRHRFDLWHDRAVFHFQSTSTTSSDISRPCGRPSHPLGRSSSRRSHPMGPITAPGFPSRDTPRKTSPSCLAMPSWSLTHHERNTPHRPAHANRSPGLLPGLPRDLVIEVGAGNGLTFAHYTPTVTEVLAVEPGSHLRRLATQAAAIPPVAARIVDGTADLLPAGEAEFDAGVWAGRCRG